MFDNTDYLISFANTFLVILGGIANGLLTKNNFFKSKTEISCQIVKALEPYALLIELQPTEFELSSIDKMIRSNYYIIPPQIISEYLKLSQSPKTSPPLTRIANLIEHYFNWHKKKAGLPFNKKKINSIIISEKPTLFKILFVLTLIFQLLTFFSWFVLFALLLITIGTMPSPLPDITSETFNVFIIISVVTVINICFASLTKYLEQAR